MAKTSRLAVLPIHDQPHGCFRSMIFLEPCAPLLSRFCTDGLYTIKQFNLSHVCLLEDAYAMIVLMQDLFEKMFAWILRLSASGRPRNISLSVSTKSEVVHPLRSYQG